MRKAKNILLHTTCIGGHAPVTHDDSSTRHRLTTQRSFAKQAEAFSRSPVMTDPEALRRMVEWAGVTGTERILDVACGPGLVAAALAPHALHVIGIDVTGAMLTRAVEIACESGTANVAFVRGDVMALPFPPGCFDRVVSRRAFHHFPEPEQVLAEMARVCAPTGAIVIEDQAAPADPAAATAMTTIDRLRDPSHTRAVHPDAWQQMFAACGFRVAQVEWMTRAHPAPADAGRARAMLEAAARGEIPGLDARYTHDGRLHFTIGLQLVRAVPNETSSLGFRSPGWAKRDG
jgi:ubiquinone/menaquinone biosynthesis C-methylase UbiE